jgi:6-phosphogluconate dehydrogenase (decarboxylating)
MSEPPLTENTHKLVLLGAIREGFDPEIAREKLAIVFDIDLKKIPKLLKKPTVIRKNLTPDVAYRYKTGLDKIGVICHISPPLETNEMTENPT